MSFIYPGWMLLYFIGAMVVCCLLFYQNRKMNQWVNDYWFYDVSRCYKVSFFLLVISLVLLFLSMGDLRGKQETMQKEIPIQKTIILLDVSLSMFAEDIRPNRLEKSIQVARHFVRKSVGHSISIVIFSDIHKQLIPFSEDIDLLDSRLSALKKLDLNRGGSSIKKAVQGAMGYLIKASGSRNSPHGNIIVISDGDDTFSEFNLDIPDTISIAYVAVGTTKGSKIPIRNKRGVLKGYKKYNGREVVSKVNELELKKWGKSIKNYYYWILTSYSIPTEKIISFLDKTHRGKFSKTEVLNRPVLMEYLVIPGLILFILSTALKFSSRYRVSKFVVIFVLLSSFFSFAEEKNIKEKKKTIEENLLYQKFKRGESNKFERLKLAEEYLKSGEAAKASDIYRENLNREDIANKDYGKAIINQGISLMQVGKVKQGVDLLNFYKDNTTDESLEKMINQNILAILKQQQQKNQEKNKNQENKKQQGKTQDKKKDDSGNSEQNKEGKKNKGEQNDKDSGKDKKRNKKKVKLPVLLKQLVDKDGKIQEKMLDTKTRHRKSSRQKDW